MRSELVFGAMKYVSNRYLLVKVAARGIRALHRPNTRIAETTNEVLTRFSVSNPVGPEPSSARYGDFKLRRAG